MANAVLEAALRSSLLIVIVWVALLVLRVRNPSLARSAWLAVLSASLAMPLLVSFEVWPAIAMPAIAVSAIAWIPDIEIGAMTVAGTDFAWQTAFVIAYCAIAVLLLLRQLVGTVRLWQLSTSARQMHALQRVRMTPTTTSPVTVFSTILVPEDFDSWSHDERAAVLAHERAHVRNHDFYIQWLAHLHRNVFWFNPLAWWLPKHLSLLSEHISDDAAIETMRDRTRYAELLVRFARRSIDSEPAVAMARAATLAARVERLLDSDGKPGGASKARKLALTAFLLPVVALVASFDAPQASPPPAPSSARERPLDPQAADLAPVGRIVLPKSNSARPLSQPIYPLVSRRLHETGTVVLKLHVLEDGSVGDAIIEKSTGHPDLDYAAMYESFRWRLDPGTVDGEPQRMWGHFAVTFKLKD